MMFSDEQIEILKNGGVGVIPTDTLYGVVGLATKPQTVERIYQIKQRDPGKPMIVLIGDVADLDRFGVLLSDDTEELLHQYWPGPVSVILACRGEEYHYLHRGTNTVAFRLPNEPALRELLQRVGPLVAPSANPEGEPSARLLDQAKKYFGNEVDFYVDGGELHSAPSTLVSIKSGGAEVHRPGAKDI